MKGINGNSGAQVQDQTFNRTPGLERGGGFLHLVGLGRKFGDGFVWFGKVDVLELEGGGTKLAVGVDLSEEAVDDFQPFEGEATFGGRDPLDELELGVERLAGQDRNGHLAADGLSVVGVRVDLSDSRMDDAHALPLTLIVGDEEKNLSETLGDRRVDKGDGSP